jgi:hypothetical protein
MSEPQDTGNEAPGADPGEPEPRQWTPPGSQDEYERTINRRVAAVHRQYGNRSPEEVEAAFDQLDALRHDLEDENERRVRETAEQTRQAVLDELGPGLVEAAFRAEAKGVLDKDALDALLEDVDAGGWKRYLGKGNKPDTERIAKKVQRLAPKDNGGGRRELPDLGGGNRGTAPTNQDMNAAIRKAAGITT